MGRVAPVFCVPSLGLLFLCLALLTPARAQTAQPGGSITGTVTAAKGADGQGGSLEGVTVTVTGPAPSGTVQTTATDGNGHYEVLHLAAGRYKIAIAEEGFEPVSADVTLTDGQAATQDVALAIRAVTEQIEVHGQATEVAAENSETPATVSSQDLEALPLPKVQTLEALPLVPGVVRTSEGKLNFKGQSESQGMLVVDSAENVDPVSGRFSIIVPIDMVQTLTVYDTPESAEYGGYSGGLTTIETRAPLGTWNYRLLDFIPGIRGKNGKLVGMSNWTPRAVFGGPLIKNKVNFSEELTYLIRKDVVRGLPWPFNETKTESLISFTEMQVIWSARHLMSINVNIFPLRQQFADSNTLVPQSASSSYGQKGAAIGVSDAYQFSSGAVVSLMARYTRFDSYAYGQGPENMLLTPEGWQGNFFNQWRRYANQWEVLPTYELPMKTKRGHNDLKVGADVLYRSYAGNSFSHPIELLREDGTPAEQINFQGAGLLSAADTETAVFADDRWTINNHWSANAGARLSTQSIGSDAAFAPHVGAAYAPGSGKTVIRIGAGLSYAHVPLLATNFADNQDRVITMFDTNGTPLGPPIVLVNKYVPAGAAAGTARDPGISPRTYTWNAEVERQIRRNVNVRVSYLDSHTDNLFVVNPVINPGGTSLLALTSAGTSQYRQAEVLVHYQPQPRADVNVSYVWSRARGDLNTLSDTFVPFQAPVIRPDVSGILESDVPQRLVAWGVVKLFWGLTLSPVADVHTGLPYSDVDALQNYVGTPNGQRFPTFFSLDARIYKDVTVRWPFKKGEKKGRKMRFGLYSLNITNHQNNHDVYNNVTSPLFGDLRGDARRFDGLVIDLVQ